MLNIGDIIAVMQESNVWSLFFIDLQSPASDEAEEKEAKSD